MEPWQTSKETRHLLSKAGAILICLAFIVRYVSERIEWTFDSYSFQSNFLEWAHTFLFVYFGLRLSLYLYPRYRPLILKISTRITLPCLIITALMLFKFNRNPPTGDAGVGAAFIVGPIYLLAIAGSFIVILPFCSKIIGEAKLIRYIYALCYLGVAFLFAWFVSTKVFSVCWTQSSLCAAKSALHFNDINFCHKEYFKEPHINTAYTNDCYRHLSRLASKKEECFLLGANYKVWKSCEKNLQSKN